MAGKREIAVKIIKKTGRILAWTSGFLLIFLTSSYFLLRSPAVQTLISRRAADYISGELNAKVAVKGVDVEFFSKIVLEGFYVQDRHGDTLLYADKFKADIQRFSFSNRYIRTGNIELDNSVVKLKKYKGEHGLSYRFLQDYFSGKPTKKKNPGAPWKVDLGSVTLSSITFAYIDTRDTTPSRGMNYQDIRVSPVSCEFSRFNPMGDSLSVHIRNLSGKEKCGFTLNSFSTILTAGDTFARFDNLKFFTPQSNVEGFISFSFHDKDDLSDDFIHLVKMDGHFSSSILDMSDIAFFAPELIGIHKKILLTGDVNGTVDNLHCRNVDIQFGKKSRIAGNFHFSGLPDISETDMNFSVRQARTDLEDLRSIPVPPFDQGKTLNVGDNIGLLGTIVFSGSFEGFLNDFVAHGKVNTALGDLTLNNLAMFRDNDSLPMSYNGEVTASSFDIGKFLGIDGVGKVTGNVKGKGSGLDEESVNANIDGHFSRFDFNNYSYTGITVTDGKLKRKSFDGKIDMSDPNAKLKFKGFVDWSSPKKDYVFDFNARIDSADLGELGFMDKSHEYILSTNLAMHFHGSNIDNIDGRLGVENLVYQKDGEKFAFNEIAVNAFHVNDSTQALSLSSDIASGNITGQFQFMQLPAAVSDIMSDYLPSYFPPKIYSKNEKKPLPQSFAWNVKFGQNTKPVKALVPDLDIAPGTYFAGNFDQRKRSLKTDFISDRIAYGDKTFSGIYLSSGNKEGYLSLTGNLARVQLSDTVGASNISINCRANKDDLLANVVWDNSSKKKNSGNISAMAHFESPTSVKMNLMQAQLYLNDSLWSVDPKNYVRVDSNTVTFHDLVFNSGKQAVGLNGIVSPRPEDILGVTVTNFNLAYLNYFTEPSGVTMTGTISSDTKLSDIEHTPIFTSNTTFSNFIVNDQKIGDGIVSADWQKAKAAVYIHGQFTKGLINEDTKQPINNILFDGYYYPKDKENSLDINSTLTNIPLETLQPVMKDFCSKLVGQIDGNLHVGGTFSKPLLNGTMNVSIRRVIVDYLGLAIGAPAQPITIEENSFFFDDYHVIDMYGDTATVYGHLYHDNFKKFQFDMDFGFDHFLVLNTTAKQNDLYYGRVFATGYMNLFGYVDEKVSIDMSASTDKIYYNGKTINSDFNIPMTSTSEVGENDFITFVSHSDLDSTKKNNRLRNNGIELNLNVQATPDALVHVIFDKTVGDELKASGTGNINMHITPAGEFTIFGNYEVEQGDYQFTMKNIPMAKFDLSKGGVLSWNGDPYAATIDADAVYHANASVAPFFPLDSANTAYTRSYPVDVIMHLDSSLMNPSISFDVNLPTADQNIQETVKSYMPPNSLELNRQVLSLMVLNSFMTPTELREGNAANSNVVAGTSATLLSNFVSGTLNNWLSQISSDVNMGVKYRPNDDLSPQELKVYLGTQLFNNRVTIDADAGKVNQSVTTGTTGNAGQFVGEANVEYKVTSNGKVRLRAFNRANDNTVLNSNSPYTQGAGIFYREEFESGAQLRKHYRDFIMGKNPNREKKATSQGNSKPSQDSAK